MMGWDDTTTTMPTQVVLSDSGSFVVVKLLYEVRRAFEMARDPHALPRTAQLEVLAQLSSEGREAKSPRERARFGFHDAPRRPCYRAPRTR